MKRTLQASLLLLVCTGCVNSSSVAPSPASSLDLEASDAAVVREVEANWSPYVGIHANSQALQAYRDALTKLQRAGRLEGVRVEINRRFQNPTDPVIKSIGNLGVELLALVGNEYLFEPNIEAVIDRLFSNYPEIRYFQIGNEVTTILPDSGPTLTIEQYMIVFQRIYNHLQARYPGRAVLLTQSTLGFGDYGARELETMANLGLANMDPNSVIVAVNAYEPETFNQYRGVLGGKLRRFRVWVTESGVSHPDQHVAFVKDRYPLLRDYLRAERVYWYVMWGGDSGGDEGFSLIRNPLSYPNYWKSPLFDVLTR